MRHLKILASALAISTATIALAASPKPTTIAAAVASSDRNPDKVKIVEGRKPAAVLSFLGL